MLTLIKIAVSVLFVPAARGGAHVPCRCGSEAQIGARYYAPADGSLRFVKLTRSGGREVTRRLEGWERLRSRKGQGGYVRRVRNTVSGGAAEWTMARTCLSSPGMTALARKQQGRIDHAGEFLRLLKELAPEEEKFY